MDNNTLNIKPNHSVMDICKVCLALLIAALHAGVNIGPFFPLYRIAVPLFFTMSGYFLFRNAVQKQTYTEKKAVILKFIFRNLKLYLFWFIILLPITLSIRREWFSSTPVLNILRFLRSLFFGSTFAASWYITASVIGVLIIWFSAKKCSNRLLLFFGAVVYFGCCILSNYYEIFRPFTPLGYCYTGWLTVFGSFVNSFPASLFWLVLGKYLAETPYKPSKNYKWIALSGFLFLLAEHYLIQKMRWCLVNDCYFMLVPTCFGLFQWMRSSRWYIGSGIRFRNFSTILYVTHYSFMQFISTLPERFQFPQDMYGRNLLIFLITICFSLSVSFLIFKLEKYKLCRWLRYAY